MRLGVMLGVETLDLDLMELFLEVIESGVAVPLLLSMMFIPSSVSLKSWTRNPAYLPGAYLAGSGFCPCASRIKKFLISSISSLEIAGKTGGDSTSILSLCLLELKLEFLLLSKLLVLSLTPSNFLVDDLLLLLPR